MLNYISNITIIWNLTYNWPLYSQLPSVQVIAKKSKWLYPIVKNGQLRHITLLVKVSHFLIIEASKSKTQLIAPSYLFTDFSTLTCINGKYHLNILYVLPLVYGWCMQLRSHVLRSDLRCVLTIVQESQYCTDFSEVIL